MIRFVTFVWHAESQTQQSAANHLKEKLRRAPENWKVALEDKGVFVAYVDDRRASKCCRLEGQTGVVLGRLFRRTHDDNIPLSACSIALSREESQRIIDTQGRSLVDSYWGSYLAVLSAPDLQKTWVLCGPMCTINCLTKEFEGVQLYFSQMRDCTALLPSQSLSVNWRFVAGHLSMRTPPNETGLNEISPIASGECCESHLGRTSRVKYWDAGSVARLEPIEDTEAAIGALYRTTRECIHSWATGYDKILLRLSGGLDSSIVLGCLRDAPSRPKVTGVNYYSTGADSDERAFARLAAQRAGCELIERARNPKFDIEKLFGAIPTEKPPLYLNVVGQVLPENLLARNSDHSVIFSGHGGDEVFFSGQVGLSAADYFNRHGFSRRLFDVAFSAARVEGLSVWKVLQQSVIQGWGARQWNASEIIRQHSPLINWDAVTDILSDERSPMTTNTAERHLPPGKQYQIDRLACDGRSRCSSAFWQPSDPETVTPLRSQPLIELSLRIPTYILTSGGWDRSLARRAFASEVPSEILRRRWKGAQEGYTAEVFARNLNFMRDVLLDGHLVREGLLNRRNLESALSGRPSNVMKGMNRISNHLAVEIWLRVWANHGALIGVQDVSPVRHFPQLLAEA